VTETRSRTPALPPIRLSDGTVEGLKWSALVLMTLDHVDKYLLHERVPLLFALGRLALPLFGVVLAFNLARPGVLEQGVYLRVLSRLAVTAAIAEIPFIALGGLAWGWYPFNILVTLIVSVSIMWLLDLGGAWRTALAILLFLSGGAVVEFWWPGVAMCVAAWSYCRRPGAWALLCWVAATAGLYLINRNLWALMAFPLIFYAPHARWRIPRIRYAFYTYYPAHLAVIWGLSATTAGP
jgi:TraX protein